MTLSMPDSIYPANLPDGYGQYLAYVDGSWPTAAAVRAAHPGARVLTLTVLGGLAVANGCDRETGDLSAASAAAWLHDRLAAGQSRPVLYASRDNVPEVLAGLAALGVSRTRIRIISAHYGAGEHICSPSACGAAFTADGTQYRDDFPGLNGSKIDMSVLADDFFGPAASTPAPSNPSEEDDMMSIVIPPGTGSPDVGVSLDSVKYREIGFLADPSRVGAAQTQVRCAFHVSGKGGEFTVVTATMTKDKPKDILAIPAGADGVSFHRLDDVNVALYPNFA